MKCYTDVAGKQITTCKETEGYRTCFTKYNDSKSKLPRTAPCATLIAAKLPKITGSKAQVQVRLGKLWLFRATPFKV